MRLAISNLAWDTSEDESVLALLKLHGVDAIDVVPGKYFPKPMDASHADITKVKDWWAKRGIQITGMQSLLFGTTGLNVFGPQESRAAMLVHLGAVCRIGGALGATRIVFGSPKNRDRSGLADEETMEMAVSFLQRLGDIAASEGVEICLEPNPPCYGANFMTTSAETAHVILAVNHPAIRLQLDTGAMAINGEDPADVLSKFGKLVGHIHASEPNLVPLGDGGTNHKDVFAALSKQQPDALVSIEMLATQEEPHMVSIKRALEVAIKCYPPAGG